MTDTNQTFDNDSLSDEDVSRAYEVAGRDARLLSEARMLIQGLRERIDMLETENEILKKTNKNNEKNSNH